MEAVVQLVGGTLKGQAALASYPIRGSRVSGGLQAPDCSFVSSTPRVWKSNTSGVSHFSKHANLTGVSLRAPSFQLLDETNLNREVTIDHL